MKIRNLVHQTAQADFNTTVEVDFSNRNLDAATALTYKPGRREAISGTDPVVVISWNGPLSAPSKTIDANQLEAYLTLRAFENSQRRIETLEAQVIEKQRIQREIAFNFAREAYKVRQAEELKRLLEEQRKQLEESERKRLEEAARKLREEIARLAEENRIREEEARRLEELRKAEEQAKLEAEQARLAEEARKREELRKAEEARILAEQKAREEALAEEARKAAALKAAEQAQQSLANPRRSEGGIVSGELPPAQPSQDDDISPTLRESIIQNIEDFLGQN